MSENTGTQKIKREIPQSSAGDPDSELTGEEIERLADLFAAEPPDEDGDTGTFPPVNTEDTGEFKPIND